MRKFGESPKRAGTVSERLGLNAQRALNVSSSLENSEKAGISRWRFSPHRKSGDLFGEIWQGDGNPAVFCCGNIGHGGLEDCRGRLFFRARLRQEKQSKKGVNHLERKEKE